MLTLKDYVNWGIAHCGSKHKKSLNLFDKDNFVVQYRYLTENEKSTKTGVSFYTSETYVSTTYAQCCLVIGNASEFRGKTITFSTPTYGGTVATKISVMKGRSVIQNGSNCVKSGDVYFSQITVADQEYTTENVCIMLYVYGKNANELIEYEKIMVNEGSEILPYEPYVK